MFDTNIFNRLVDGNINISSLEKDNKYYVTHIQLDELNNTRDETRRLSLLKAFQIINSEKVPTESAAWGISRWDEAKFSDELSDNDAVIPTSSFVLGVSRLGMGKLSDGTLYNSLLNELTKRKPDEKENNIKDALIAEASIKNNFTLITADDALYQVVKKLSGNVLSWDGFVK